MRQRAKSSRRATPRERLAARIGRRFEQMQAADRLTRPRDEIEARLAFCLQECEDFGLLRPDLCPMFEGVSMPANCNKQSKRIFKRWVRALADRRWTCERWLADDR